MEGPKFPVETHRNHRINAKASVIFVVSLVLLGFVVIPVKIFADRAVRRTALEQARALSNHGDLVLAIRSLERYLEDWPDDVDALEVQAKVLFEGARSADDVLGAADVINRLLRLSNSGPGRQDLCKRLVRLYIQYSEAVRDEVSAGIGLTVEAFDSRHVAAMELGEELVAYDRKNQLKDAESHRLLALACETDARRLDDAVKHFEEALEIDHGDIVSAEHLGRLYLEETNRPKLAEATLDSLLEDRPGSLDVLLARHRFFVRARQYFKAKAELAAALKLAPGDLILLLTVAEEALRNHDTVAARSALVAIPGEFHDDLRVRLLLGSLEFEESHPNEAFDQWRRGLSIVGGSHLTLTWQLAYSMIKSGRFGEARPLVMQYQRLVGKDAWAMGEFLQAILDHYSGRSAKALGDLERIGKRLPPSAAVEYQIILGRSREAVGDLRGAEQAIRLAASLDPRESEPHRELARFQSRHNPKAASGEMELALKMDPENPTLLVDVGRLRLSEQLAVAEDRRDFGHVEELLSRARKCGPNDSNVRLFEADFLASTGKLDQSVKLLGRAVEGEDRRNYQSWVSLANGLDRLGQHDRALKALEDAAAPDAVGDHPALRVSRARLLAAAGHGRAAREALTSGIERLGQADRAELAHTLGDLNRDLGDRDGARIAYDEWARQAPQSPMPGLVLLDLAQTCKDDEAARLGLAHLQAVGGDQEPYGLAAQALELLRDSPRRPGGPNPDELDRAQRLCEQIKTMAPQLAIHRLIRGMIMERRDLLGEAEVAYRQVIEDPSMTSALPRLIGILTRLRRYHDLAILRKKYEERTPLAKRADALLTFDRVASRAALKYGDKERAERLAAQVVAMSPGDPRNRAYQVRLLDELGKPREAEKSLRDLVERRPGDPEGRLSLVRFQALRGEPGEAEDTIARIPASYQGEYADVLQAQCSHAAGDRASAIRRFDEALASHPDDLEVLKAVALFDEETGRLDESEAILRRALKLDPTVVWASRMLALRVASGADLKAWSQGWDLVDSRISTASETPEDRLTRAAILTRCPEYSRRIQAGSSLAALADDLPATHPVGIRARLLLSKSMLDGNRALESSRVILPVADDEKRLDPAALAIAVEALARSGDVGSALLRLERLVAHEPDSTRTLAARAWVLQSQGKSTEAGSALEAAEVAAERMPDGESAAVTCHDLLRQFGWLDDAGQVAARIARRWPRQSHLVARYQSARGEINEAMASCRKAVEAGAPPDALKVAVGVAMDHGRDRALLNQADELAGRALVRTPNDPDVLVILAKIRHEQHRCSDELALYRQALALNPINVRFLNDMAWDLSEVFQEPNEGLARIDELIRREGPQPGFLDTRGAILTRLGRLDEAIVALELSTKARPAPVTYFHLARAYHKVGKNEGFRRSRELAEKAGFDPRRLDPSDRTDLDEVMGGR